MDIFVSFYSEIIANIRMKLEFYVNQKAFRDGITLPISCKHFYSGNMSNWFVSLMRKLRMTFNNF